MTYRPNKLKRSFFFSYLTIGIIFSIFPLLVLAQDSSKRTQTIMVLGDSISAGYGMNLEEGWVTLLDRQLIQNSSNWEMQNASISGETTSGALARLPDLITSIQPEIVIIELGGNDGLRGYPITKMRANLESMVSLVMAASGTPILMAMRIPPNYGARYTKAFEQSYYDIAKDKNISIIPFAFQDFLEQEGLMQQDGIHPSAEAQPRLAEVVGQHLSRHLQ